MSDPISIYDLGSGAIPVLLEANKKLLEERDQLKSRVKELEEALRGHCMGMSYTRDGVPLKHHCLCCDESWDAACVDEHHADDCPVRRASTSIRAVK